MGLAVVNEDTSLYCINNYMFTTLNIDPEDFRERMLGNAFRCSYIYSTGKNVEKSTIAMTARFARF